MKEVKKTTSAKKPVHKKTVNSKSVNNKPVNNKPANDAPVVKEIKVAPEKTAKDEENNKLIVVIAIAILVIIGTVIGLLVGCTNKENEEGNNTTEEPDVVVVPDEKEEEEPVKKVVKTTTESTEQTYIVEYFNNGKKVNEAKITSGGKAKRFIPSGYSKCNYYTDSNMNETFDFGTALTSDVKIYLSCELKSYTVTYFDEDGSQIGETVTLVGEEAENYEVNNNSEELFLGWGLNPDNNVIAYKAGVTVSLNDNLNLYAKYGETTITFTNKLVDNPEVVVPEKEETEEEVVETTEPLEDTVLDGETTEVEENTPFEDTVVGVENVDEFQLPENPNELGIETPTYFVPAGEEDEGALTIVDDELEEIEEGQIKLSDVEGRTPDWYLPELNQKVNEKEYIFVGYTEPETGDEIDPNGYTPKKEEENNVEINWAYQAGDETAPVEETTETAE